jgi:hypothetical protein
MTSATFSLCEFIMPYKRYTGSEEHAAVERLLANADPDRGFRNIQLDAAASSVLTLNKQIADYPSNNNQGSINFRDKILRFHPAAAAAAEALATAAEAEALAPAAAAVAQTRRSHPNPLGGHHLHRRVDDPSSESMARMEAYDRSLIDEPVLRARRMAQREAPAPAPAKVLAPRRALTKRGGDPASSLLQTRRAAAG